MKVVIVNADNKNIKTDSLSFLPLEGGTEEEQEKRSIDFNLLNPPFINPESSSEQAFGYSFESTKCFSYWFANRKTLYFLL